MKTTLKILLWALVCLLGSNNGRAQDRGFEKAKLNWDKISNQGFILDVLGSDGRVVAQAIVRPERWNRETGDLVEYVARFEAGSKLIRFKKLEKNIYIERANTWEEVRVDDLVDDFEKVGGQFVLGYHGKLRKWAIDTDGIESQREEIVLEFRNSKGQFLTWMPIENYIERGWNKYENGEKWYEVRYSENAPNELAGRFLTKARMTREFVDYKDGNICPRLIIRDTKGRITTVVVGSYGKQSHICYYNAPENERQWLIDEHEKTTRLTTLRMP